MVMSSQGIFYFSKNRQFKMGTLLSVGKWWCFYLVYLLTEGAVFFGSQSYDG